MFRLFKNIDPWLILPVVILSAFSLSVLVSIKEQFVSQAIFFILGLILFILLSKIDFSLYKALSPIFYGISLFLLLFTLLGPKVRETTRWIEIFGLRWQPSEIVKPLLVFTFASFFSVYKARSWRVILLASLLLLLPLFLIFKQPDLGNTIILFGIWLGIVYASELPFFYGFWGAVVFLSSLPVFFHFLKDYQKARILSFMNPGLDPQGAGYHSLQAMIAVGSGLFFGRGLGEGPQSKLLFLPEYHTDFIFSALVEQFGFLGGSAVIFCYFVLLFRLLQIARKTQEPFAAFCVFGFFSQFLLQIFINIGMNLGIVPVTGITLPLLSYGGSSVLSVFISLGIISNIQSSEKKTGLDILS